MGWSKQRDEKTQVKKQFHITCNTRSYLVTGRRWYAKSSCVTPYYTNDFTFLVTSPNIFFCNDNFSRKSTRRRLLLYLLHILIVIHLSSSTNLDIWVSNWEPKHWCVCVRGGERVEGALLFSQKQFDMIKFSWYISPDCTFYLFIYSHSLNWIELYTVKITNHK